MKRMKKYVIALSVVTSLLLSAISVSGSNSSTLTNQKVKFSGGERSVSYVTVDLKDSSIQIESVVAKNKVGAVDTIDNIASLAKKSDNEVIAAINGTYFSAYNDETLPWGTIQKGGKVIHVGNTGATIGFTADNRVKVDNLYITIDGYINGTRRWYAWNINHTFESQDAISIFTREYGSQTHSHDFTSIIVNNGKVVDIKNGRANIPTTGFVIVTGHSQIISRFSIGDEVYYETVYQNANYSNQTPQVIGDIDWNDVTTSIGAGPTLLKNGVIIANGENEGFFESKINSARGQRSFIGVTYGNKLVFGTVPSVSVRELAEITKNLGLYNAINLDGGASSGLFFKGKVIHKPGRLISNAIVITSSKNKVEEKINVEVNGRKLSFDQPPVNIGGRIMVPLRMIFEALDADVNWDSATQTVTGNKGEKEIELKIGSNNAKINNVNTYLEAPARIINGRTLVPARFIAESLGAEVEWISSSKTVKIKN